MPIGNEFGSDIAFSGFGLVVVITETQFQTEPGKDDLSLLGLSQVEDDSRNLKSDRNPFGEPWFTGPSYTESYNFEFRLQGLSETQARLLEAMRRSQRNPANRTPIRFYNRRKIFTESGTRTRGQVVAPAVTLRYQIPGHSYYWAQYDIEFTHTQNALELQRGSCPSAPQELTYFGTLTATEMQLVPTSEDVADLPAQTVVTQ